jgi:DNA-binding GntR family transcriptional regulator
MLMTSLQQKTVEEIEFAIMSGELRPRQRLV